MRSILAACFAASLALTGCAVDADRDDLENESDTSENAGALSAYGDKLVGAFETTEGAADFDTIVLKADGTYFSTKRIVCITTPCDPIRDEGKFIGYKPSYGGYLGGLRLISKKGKSTYYRVSLGVANETFKLAKSGTSKFYKYNSVGTYCQAAADCGGQSYITPKCVGYKTCDTATNKCGYKCGTEPTKCSLTDPTKRYVGSSKEMCMVIRYTCDFAAGETSFSDDCGCGCTVAPKPACKPSGCSGQVCSDKDVITTCEWREQYACYQKVGVCERGADGACAWRKTPELSSCLGAAL